MTIGLSKTFQVEGVLASEFCIIHDLECNRANIKWYLSFPDDMLEHFYHVWQSLLCSFACFVFNHPTSNGWGVARQLASAKEAY
jgi:hypothetical protein